MPADPTEPVVWPGDLDVDTIPKVNPREVARTEQDGKPTQWALNWEQAQNAWFQKTVVDLNSRLTKVYSETDFAYAAVTTLAEAFTDSESAYAAYTVTVEARFLDVEASVITESTARSTADSALATSITTVQTNLNGITASGQVYLSAKSAPGGATAAYGWHLTAGSAFTGMEAIALSGGGSAIGFTADKFRFTDSGTAQPWLTYSGGKIQFTGAVAIDGSLTINGTVYTNAAAANAFTQAAGSVTTGQTATVGVVVRAGASVSIQACFVGASGLYWGLATPIGSFTIYRDGSAIGTVGSQFEASGSGGSAGISFQATPYMSVDAPGAGYHSYVAETTNGAGLGGVCLVVTELAR